MQESFDPYLHWLDIDPHERPINHYRLLGIRPFEDDDETIRAAAEERMAEIHAYQTGPHAKASQQLLNELSAAKLCLLNPVSKQSYDAVLQGQLSAEPPISRPAPRGRSVAAVASKPPIEPPIVSNTVSEEEPDVAEPSASRVRIPFHELDRFPLYVLLGLVLLTALVWGIGFLMTRGRPEENKKTKQPSRKQPSKTIKPPTRRARTIVQRSDGVMELKTAAARLHGKNLRYNSREGRIDNWIASDDSLSWSIHVKQPGIFRAEITYTADPAAVGGRYELSVGNTKAASDLRVTPDSQSVTDTVYLAIRKRGKQTISLRAVNISGQSFIALELIRLLPKARLP